MSKAHSTENSSIGVTNTDWSEFDLKEREEEASCPYWEEDILYYLYRIEDYTLKEIGDRYDVSQGTISQWLSRHNISTERHGCFTYQQKDNGKEYALYFDSQPKSVAIHQLVAILNNDPHKVFAADTNVHHRIPTKVPMDIPSNVEIVQIDEHIRLHQSDDVGESLDDISFEQSGVPLSKVERLHRSILDIDI